MGKKRCQRVDRGKLPCPLLSRGDFQVGEQQAQSMCVCQIVHALLFDCKTFPVSVVTVK